MEECSKEWGVALMVGELYLAQTFVTTVMVGVIWTVQIVIYPLFYPFAKNGENDQLEKLHEYYTPKITKVVLPLMFTELGLSLWAAFSHRTLWDISLLLLVVFAWAITFFVSVPCHNILANGSDGELKLQAATRLIGTNWLRTLAWSLRALILWYFYI
jgi:hypothetical protein